MTDLCGTCRTCRHSETMWSQEPCNSCGVGRENFEPDGIMLENVQEDVLVTPAYTPPPMPTVKPARALTNREKLMAMTDAELAESIIAQCDICAYTNDKESCDMYPCTKGIAIWLGGSND